MEKLKVAIIDDEAKAIALLESMINEHFPEYEVIGSAKTLSDGIQLVSGKDIDVLLLDVNLGIGTGFELLRKTRLENCAVIFVTAYSEFALEAFRANAIDYLLKPVALEEMREALNKAKSWGRRSSLEKIEDLISSISSHGHPRNIAIHEHGHITLVNFHDILYLKAAGQYTEIHLADKRKIESSHNLGYFEDRLTGASFFRCHRSFIVNLSYIKGIDTENQYLELSASDHKVSYSALLKEEILGLLKQK